jgi:hypothetical protein
MSTVNTDTSSFGAATVVSDGCVFTLNDAYASPGLIVATAATEPAQERAEERAHAGTNGPVRHAAPEDSAVIDTMWRAMDPNVTAHRRAACG